MDKRVEQIIAGFKRLLQTSSSSFIASVIEDKIDTVDIEDLNEVCYLDVRKIATQDSKGLIPKLKKGSYVIVSRLSNSDELYISMMSEIEGFDVEIEGQTLSISKDGFIFNKGENGGLIKIQELTDKVNELVDWCTNHTHSNAAFSGTIGGATAVGALTVPAPIAPPQKLNKSDFENNKIKH